MVSMTSILARYIYYSFSAGTQFYRKDEGTIFLHRVVICSICFLMNLLWFFLFQHYMFKCQTKTVVSFIIGLIFACIMIALGYLFRKSYQAKDSIYHMLGKILINLLLSTLMYWTPGTNTFKLLIEENNKYISLPLAEVGLFSCILWLIYNLIEICGSTHISSIDNIWIYFLTNIVNLILCLIQIRLYYKYKKIDENTDKERLLNSSINQ